MVCAHDFNYQKTSEDYRDSIHAACEFMDAYYHTWTNPGSEQPALPFMKSRSTKMSMSEKTFDIRSLGRKFCLTRKGYVGWVPLRWAIQCAWLREGRSILSREEMEMSVSQVDCECYILDIRYAEAMDIEECPLQDLTWR